MEKRADSGFLTVLAAVVAPFAAAAAKRLFERRRRSPIQSEEQEMCRNHSHMTGVLLEALSAPEFVEAKILVTQDLTLEILSGEKLIVPRYSVCLVLRDDVTQSVGRRLHEMAEQGNLQLHKDGDLFSSGHITQPK